MTNQLDDIRANNSDNSSLAPFYIPEAAYVERLIMTAATGKGEGAYLKYNKRLYIDWCTECHGENGEGDSNKAYPLNQNQHYSFLLCQFYWIKSIKQRNVNKEIMITIDDFGKHEFKALAGTLPFYLEDRR
ncbi:MAG: hypothetical protein KZQ85_17195 [Candidatus Thiodiazotropha sp. (ex Myrtea sp. 'scaly one' KF741663)]|nr:hypothetical protein [Candidatus Thiodiazotropha sp. (ex Myrtea sp. 'scaly one' KF741663)]